MIPRRLRLAVLLAFCLHGFLVLIGEYHFSFDAYTHMFFADHYRSDWFGLWEPRWYTGFSVSSYPPLVHQLIALLGRLIGVDAGFGLLLWAVMTAYPLAAYAFCRAFGGGRVAAGYAALGAALLPSAYLAAYDFGQLPTLTATLAALFGLAALAEFLRRGERLGGLLAVALFAVVMAAHHATLLFLPWAVAGLVLHLFLEGGTDRRDLFRRLARFALPAAIAAFVVIWPFWAWGRGQGIQVPIDHPTRHNFLADPFAVIAFFLPVYGPLMALIPFALWKARERRYTGLGLAFLPLFILGLGGTTPLPRLLFGAGWEWLTYDRFAFWASLLLLPFLGVALLPARRALPKDMRLGVHIRLVLSQTRKRHQNRAHAVAAGRPRRWMTFSVFLLLAVVALTIGLLPTLMPFEPAKIDMQPIVDFLAKKNHSRWRYVTFGFGDQLAALSRLTDATTIDGSYHTARALPELRESGIAQIDTAYWTIKGIRALRPILKKSGEHGVRWGFVSLAAYIPMLKQSGWVRLTTLSNGVQVWENPAAVLPLPARAPPTDPLASFSWGVLPLLSLAIAIGLAGMRLQRARAQTALFAVQQFALGLLPLALCFWYFLTIFPTQIEGIYFTYTKALLFASDALAAVALAAWLVARHSGGSPGISPGLPALKRGSIRDIWNSLLTARPERWLLALCLLASASVLWSADWRVSLYVSLHLWLAFGLFLSARDRPAAWRALAFGFCAALFLEVLLGFWQFAAQSTAFMQPLGLNWPGTLEPSMRGTSIVQLADGVRWLRVYGTFPHPNILGGMVIAFMAGPLAIFLSSARRRPWMALLFALGSALLVLTFSRSAWLGLAAAALALALQHRALGRKRLLALAVAGLAGLLAAALPLSGLILARMGGSPALSETFAGEARAWLIQETLGIIRDHPVLGVGVGASIVEYARRVPYGYLVEPVHNLPLLVVAELGLPGLLVLAGLVVSLVRGGLAAPRLPAAAVFTAVLTGLAVTALFDHYLWTLAPGRLLLALMLGLWAGQARRDQEDKHATDPL